MMQAMRERVKAIFWIVIVSFILLMFLGWGIGDWSSPNRGAPGIPPVAVVNGEDVDARLWQQRTDSILRSMRQRGNGTVTESDRLRARDQAYDELINDVLFRQEAERRKLSVTDAEIDDLLENDPPPSLLAQFTLPDGTIDYQSYYDALDDARGLGQVRAELRRTLPLEKLMRQLQNGAVVGETELREAYEEQTTQMVIEWAGRRFADIDLEDDAVTDEQAQSYYEANLDDYKQAPRATVRLVKIAKEASEADEQDLLSILTEIRQEILDGHTTFEDAARTYSEDTSASVGGDLGFFDRNRMVEPFTEAAFELAVGDVSAPVRTQFGYHIIECTDERLDDNGERTEMRARHVLLKLQPSPDTLVDLNERAQAVHEQAGNVGLDAAASEAELEVVETVGFQENFNIPGVPNSAPGSRFAFEHDTGALSPLMETEESFYFFEVGEKIPAGHRALDEVRSLVDSAVLRSRRAEIARTQLTSALAGVSADTDLSSLANENGLQYAMTDTFTLRENVSDLGTATSVARVALASEVGSFHSGVETNRGVYGFRVIYKSEFDENLFSAQRAQLAQQVLFTRQRMMLQQWIMEQRESAKIEDRRSDLL